MKASSCSGSTAAIAAPLRGAWFTRHPPIREAPTRTRNTEPNGNTNREARRSEKSERYCMRSRIYQPEIMDEETLEQETVDEIYRYLASVNRYFGGVGGTIARFEDFSKTWRAGERIDVLEIACGAADVPRALIAWGRSRGFDLRVTATDILPSALDYARRAAHRSAPAPGMRGCRVPAVPGSAHSTT